MCPKAVEQLMAGERQKRDINRCYSYKMKIQKIIIKKKKIALRIIKKISPCTASSPAQRMETDVKACIVARKSNKKAR